MANYITTDTELQSVANAIRTKGGTSNQLEYPTGFVSAIQNIPSGGGVDPSWLQFSGNLEYFNYGGYFTPYLQMNKSSVTFTGVTNCSRLLGKQKDWSSVDPTWNDFDWMTLEFPSQQAITGLCYGSGNYNNLEKLPHISIQNNGYVSIGNQIFADCRYVKSMAGVFPYDESLSGVNSTSTELFGNMCSLRQFPDSIWRKVDGKTSIGNSYQRWFQNCFALDKIENLPIFSANGSLTTGAFSNFLVNGYRLSKITFQTDNGTPFEINVTRNLTWDLRNTGFAPTAFNFEAYGISNDKKVTGQESYNLLKNDPDWWTTDATYSRFNKESALALFRSLPVNTNSTYKVTIQLNYYSGQNTDEGGISDLTTEDYKIAQDKGWTVTTP